MTEGVAMTQPKVDQVRAGIAKVAAQGQVITDTAATAAETAVAATEQAAPPVTPAGGK